ncbi:MAG: universal stress protein, partial [Chloroflexi bacterium]|nr:universal stress protein [Chloroflexota bacterium]
MAVYSNLLVPLDGSPLAERALPYALSLAERTGARLLLLRVLAPLPGKGEGAAAGHDDTEGATLAYLEGRRRQATERGLSCQVAVVYGSPAAAILDAVAANGCDLVAMSTHGRSG